MAPDPTVPGHADRVQTAMARWDTGRVWPNVEQAHDVVSASRAYSPHTLVALASIAAAYDPDGVLAGGAYLRTVRAGFADR
jgi:hypothetical protein